MYKASWLPNWKAWAIRRNGKLIGLVRFYGFYPFRVAIDFV